MTPEQQTTLERLADVIEIVQDTIGRDHLYLKCRVGVQSDYWLRKPPGEGVGFTATTGEDGLGAYLANERPDALAVPHEVTGLDRCSALVDGNSVPVGAGLNYVLRVHGLGANVIGAFVETPGSNGPTPPGGAVNKQLMLVQRDEAVADKVGRYVILGPDGTIAVAGTMPVPQPWPR